MCLEEFEKNCYSHIFFLYTLSDFSFEIFLFVISYQDLWGVSKAL